LNRCPYCFAPKSAGPDEAFLTREEHDFYIGMLKRSNERSLRLLGGEPFLHPDIAGILEGALADEWFTSITLFTTGFVPERYRELLRHDKINLVVNVNHPRYYPEGRYRDLVRGLEDLADRRVALTIGYNIFEENFDYEPVLRLARAIGVPRVRWAVAVPSPSGTTICLDREQKKSAAARVVQFIEDAMARDLTPIMDCPVEPCVFSDEQILKLARLSPSMIAAFGRCHPVIDLGPGFQANRCFAAGPTCAVDARDFEDLASIEAHYMKTVDEVRPLAAGGECLTCKYLERRLCQTGCIAAALPRIQALGRHRDALGGILDTCRTLCRNREFSSAAGLLESELQHSQDPALLLEYANILLKAEMEGKFMKFVEANQSRMLCNGPRGGDMILAKFHELRGDIESARGYLRRCLRSVVPERRESIRRMIESLQTPQVPRDEL
jgi:cyclic pyranopterin phosphate synthase